MTIRKLYSEMGAKEIQQDVQRRKDNGEKKEGYRHLVTKAVKHNEILRIRKMIIDILRNNSIEEFDSLEMAMDYINDIDMVEIFPEAKEDSSKVRSVFKNLRDNRLGHPKNTNFSKAKKMYFTKRNGLIYGFFLSELIAMDSRFSSKETALRTLLGEAGITVKAPEVEEFVKMALKNKEIVDILSEEDIPFFNTMLSEKVLAVYKTFLDIAISKAETVVKDGKFVFFLADSYLANNLSCTYGRATVNRIMKYLESLSLVTRVSQSEASQELVDKTSYYHNKRVGKKSETDREKFLKIVKFYRVDNLAENIKSGELAEKVNNLYHMGVRYSSISKDKIDYINNFDRLFDEEDIEFQSIIDLVTEERERYANFERETNIIKGIIERQLENDGIIIKKRILEEYTEGLGVNRIKEKTNTFKIMIDKILVDSNFVPMCRKSMAEELKALVSPNGVEAIYIKGATDIELSIEDTMDEILESRYGLEINKPVTFEQELDRKMERVVERVIKVEEDIDSLTKDEIDDIIDQSKDDLRLNREKVISLVRSLPRDRGNKILEGKKSTPPPIKLNRKELREREFVKSNTDTFIDYLRKDFNYGGTGIVDTEGIKRVCNKRKILIDKTLKEVRDDYRRGLATTMRDNDKGINENMFSDNRAKFENRVLHLIEAKKSVRAIKKTVFEMYEKFQEDYDDAF